MRPAYKFPRSQASLDLSEANRAAASGGDNNAPQAGPSGSVSHPSLLVTDSYGQPAGLDDEQDVVRFSDATTSAAPKSGPSGSQPNPAHLSASLFPSKSLSRISEYSESAYSSGSHSRDSQDRAQSPTLSYLYSPKQRETSTSSYSFPAPPPSAHLAASSSSTIPAPILATAPLAPSPAPVAFRVRNPDERHPDEGLAAPRKHHLPSRPLTTPFPSEGLAPVPVPLDNFAAPPGRERADSPHHAGATGSRSPSPEEYRQANNMTMVQIPGQAVIAQDPHRYSYHVPGASQSTTQTAWQSAEEDFDAKFDSRSALFNSNGGAYDSAAAFGGISDDYDTYPERGASANRFTLDDDEKVRRRRQDSDGASALSSGVQGWDPEREKKGSNKWIWWSLLALLVIGAAVGLGVGLSKKHQNDSASVENAAQRAAAGSPSSDASIGASAPASLTIPTVLHPSSATVSFSSPADATAAVSSATVSTTDAASTSATPTSTAAPDNAVETFSTTFGYERDGSTTVVPLTYTIPSSFDTRTNGQWQFTERVVLPNLSGTGSFTSDLRFRIQPTTQPTNVLAAVAAVQTQAEARVQKRSPRADSKEEEPSHWKRHHRSRLIR
ncbi:hypothetical protein JCM10908_007367 [Rhodotorula pacifica]|uniref:uncharacterized protein n=1 Tax=Rhodotorula pacifica TaxID=1495444 RepID=UPI00316FE9F3